MRKWILISLAGLLTCPSPSESSKLPRQATYHIFIHALDSGTNKISIEERDQTIILTSVTHMAYEKSQLDVRSRTVADARTFRTLSYEYDGVQDGKHINGHFSTSGDTIKGVFLSDGHEFEWKNAIKSKAVFAIEDYHFEHYMLLMKAYAKLGGYVMKEQTVNPSSTILSNVTLYTESERELPVGKKSIVCKKVAISFPNSSPFIVYVDPAEELPIYLGFPFSKTEALLESYYGENPTPYYMRLDKENQSE